MSTNSKNVQAWRKRVKQKLVDVSGGKCVQCWYDKCQSALEFHHLDPSEKDFSVTGSANTKSLRLLLDEVKKCVMLCSNCHREVHAGLIDPTELADKQFFDVELAKMYLDETEAAKVSGRFIKK